MMTVGRIACSARKLVAFPSGRLRKAGSRRDSPYETGWKVGGVRAWLHVAATREDSYYQIERGRGTREGQI